LLGLETLPLLSQPIDVTRPAIITADNQAVVQKASRSLAVMVHPDLVRERFAIQKLQAELQNSLRSWWPTFTIAGDVSLSGSRYPLNRPSWSVALVMQFFSPYLSGSLQSRSGWEPPYDRTASLQSSSEVLPDPAAGLNTASAEAALALEQERLRLLTDQANRQAERAVSACVSGGRAGVPWPRISLCWWKRNNSLRN